MSFFTREHCLQRLRTQIAAGNPIIGGGAGTGISAKCAEAGGIDLIIIYNSGRFRMAGRGSLCRHDALRRRQRRSSWTWPARCCPSSSIRRSWPACAAPIRFAS